METEEALTTLKLLCEGKDPRDGMPLPPEHVCQRSGVVRTFFIAVDAVERMIEQERRRANRPSKTGAPWTEEEELQLTERHEQGASVAELARELQRTTGAIEARLVKLGRLDESVLERYRRNGERPGESRV